MKTIEIYDLLPFMRKGWVAMDSCKQWWWYEHKPQIGGKFWQEGEWNNDFYDEGEKVCLERCCCFNIKEFQGDWKDSLISTNKKNWAKCGQNTLLKK